MAPSDHGEYSHVLGHITTVQFQPGPWMVLGSLLMVEGNHILPCFPFYQPLHWFVYSATYSFQTGRNCSFRGWEDSRDISSEQKLVDKPSKIEKVTTIYCLIFFPSAFSQVYYFFLLCHEHFSFSRHSIF